MERDVLLNVSPIDGRYYDITHELEDYFSEYAYMKNRVLVECRWLIYFVKEVLKKEVDEENIINIYGNFSLTDAHRVKELEVTTNHDVKAIEYYIRERLTELDL